MMKGRLLAHRQQLLLHSRQLAGAQLEAFLERLDGTVAAADLRLERRQARNVWRNVWRNGLGAVPAVREVLEGENGEGSKRIVVVEAAAGC